MILPSTMMSLITMSPTTMMLMGCTGLVEFWGIGELGSNCLQAVQAFQVNPLMSAQQEAEQPRSVHACGAERPRQARQGERPESSFLLPPAGGRRGGRAAAGSCGAQRARQQREAVGCRGRP